MYFSMEQAFSHEWEKREETAPTIWACWKALSQTCSPFVQEFTCIKYQNRLDNVSFHSFNVISISAASCTIAAR